jgi:hypothetical protein
MSASTDLAVLVISRSAIWGLHIPFKKKITARSFLAAGRVEVLLGWFGEIGYGREGWE